MALHLRCGTSHSDGIEHDDDDTVERLFQI